MNDHISCANCGSVVKINRSREGQGLCDLCWFGDPLPYDSETYRFALIHDAVGDADESESFDMYGRSADA